MSKVYDTIIIGGGPAGMTAAVYASRAKMSTLVVEQKRTAGGQAATTSEIENYPGYASTTGPVLMKDFRDHAEKFGAEFIKDKVDGITVNDCGFLKTVKLKKKGEFTAKTVLISTGAEPRVLGIPGEATFRGAGVSYCATCDADFFEDLDIVIVGNGNTAVEEAVYLSKFVNKITMVVIHDEGIMDADKIAQEHAKQNPKINFIWNSTVDEICGEDMVNKVRLRNVKTGELSDFDCDGVFMFVGTTPRVEFLNGMVELNKQNYIKVNERMETSVPGIFACGDVIEKYLRQVVTAAGDGAIAAVAAGKFIEEEENWQDMVIKSEKPVVVAFWSPLSQADIDLTSQLESNLSDDYRFVKIDYSRSKYISEKYQIKNELTILKMENGEIVNRVNSKSESDLNEVLS